MDDKGKIVWLASYPKSGNTWFRIFITNLYNDSDKPADINNLKTSTIASSRQMFDRSVGINSSDLTADEIDMIRPEVYRFVASGAQSMGFHKIHDAYRILPSGEALIPREITKAVIYIIRNPLDVAISFANHSDTSIDKAIENMNNPKFALCKRKDRLHTQLRQILLSWTDHVESWVDQSDLPVHIMKYENMVENSFVTFKKAINFVGLNFDNEQIERALAFSSFGVLKEQELKNGFKEKSPKSASFFRKGRPDDWKEVLSSGQVENIVQKHQKTMERFGYWPLK